MLNATARGRNSDGDVVPGRWVSGRPAGRWPQAIACRREGRGGGSSGHLMSLFLEVGVKLKMKMFLLNNYGWGGGVGWVTGVCKQGVGPGNHQSMLVGWWGHVYKELAQEITNQWLAEVWWCPKPTISFGCMTGPASWFGYILSLMIVSLDNPILDVLGWWTVAPSFPSLVYATAAKPAANIRNQQCC